MTKNNIKKFFKEFYYSFTWIAILLVVVDLATKWAIQLNFELGESLTLIPNFLAITLVHNKGAAFGMGDDSGVFRYIFIAVSLLVSIGMAVYFFKKQKDMKTWVKIVFALIFSGAVGNLIDRALYWENIVGFSGVIDWISFTFGTYHFPVFNIADSAVVIGVILVLLFTIIEEAKSYKTRKAAGEFDLPPLEYEEKIKKEEAEAKVKEETKQKDQEENEELLKNINNDK